MRLLHELLADASQAVPGGRAIDEGDRSWTFAEVAGRSHQLARSLRACGVRPGDRVGVALDPGYHALVSLFAVSEAGGVYVPLGANPTAERRRLVATDADLRAIVEPAPGSPPGADPAVRHGGTGGALLDDAGSWMSWSELDRESCEILPARRTANDVAYIFYTSGSTGTPKGVAHRHSSCASFVDWAVTTLVTEPTDRVAAAAALTFDISLLELVVPIARRASIVVLDRSLMAFPGAFAMALERAAPTVLQLVPTVWRTLLDAPDALRSVRVAVVTGERLAPKDWIGLRSVAPTARLVNVYGSTEVNDCTAFEFPATWPDPTREVPVGRPVAGTRIELVGPNGDVVSDDEAGELVVAGPMLACGYWNREAEYAGRVIRLVDGTVGFRTGDRARRDVAGDLCLEGRLGRMVKVRGEWVNLTDVETAAHQHPAVEAAVAVLSESEGADNMVRLLVTVRCPVDPAELIRHCGVRLARPARPRVVDVVDELPLNANGKIDLARLSDRATLSDSMS